MEGTLFRFRLLFLFLLFLFFLLLGCDSNAQNVERPRDRRPPPATIKRRPLIGPPKEPISVLDYDHTSVLDGGTRLPIVLAKSLDILFFFWFLFFSFFFYLDGGHTTAEGEGGRELDDGRHGRSMTGSASESALKYATPTLATHDHTGAPTICGRSAAQPRPITGNGRRRFFLFYFFISLFFFCDLTGVCWGPPEMAAVDDERRPTNQK